MPTVLTYVAAFALVLAYLALVTAYLALRTLARLRRATSVLARGGDGHETILEATERQVEVSEQLVGEVAALRQEIAELQDEVDELADRPPVAQTTERTELTGLTGDLQADVTALQGEVADLNAAVERGLRNVALVRYDAFDDMAGRMSFSLALLDNAGDGVVLSAITGRSDTRVYAKGVTGGHGEHELSPEEHQAVSAALARQGRSGLAGLAGFGRQLVRRRAG